MHDIHVFVGNSCRTHKTIKLSTINTFAALRRRFRSSKDIGRLDLVVVGGNNLVLTPKVTITDTNDNESNADAASMVTNSSRSQRETNTTIPKDSTSSASISNVESTNEIHCTFDCNNTNVSSHASPITNHHSCASDHENENAQHASQQHLATTSTCNSNNNESLRNNHTASSSNVIASNATNTQHPNQLDLNDLSDSSCSDYEPATTNTNSNSIATSTPTRARRIVNPPNYYSPAAYSQTHSRNNVALSQFNSCTTSTSTSTNTNNNNNIANDEGNIASGRTLILSSDSEIEENNNSTFISPISQPSKGFQIGELWYKNEDDIPLSENNLKSRSDLFRSNLVKLYGYTPPFTIQMPENITHYTWQVDVENMDQKDFENTKHIHKMFMKKIRRYKRNPRKLFKSTSIYFTGENQLGTDAGGLTTEAIERFATSFLSIFQQKHPDLFEVLNDNYITIKRIPKTSSERDIIKEFLFVCEYIIIHTGHFPTLCDPTLLISIFNYSFKLEDIFYSPYNCPFPCMEKDYMLDFHKLCRNKPSSGILDQHVADESPLGMILEYIEFRGVHKVQVDRALKKGEFPIFMKKDYHKRSVEVGKWCAKELLPIVLSMCGIKPHEMCQMINHFDEPFLYWSHYQPVNHIDDFIECLQSESKDIITNTVSFIKRNAGCDIVDLMDKNLIREIVFKDKEDISTDQVEQLLKCFIVMYLYLAPPKLISSFYESITSKKYHLGYRGIKFIFNEDHTIERPHFMRVASCYLEVEFFTCKELSTTLLESYKNFSFNFDLQLDSLSYTTC